jgi:phage I-like protein
MPGITTALHLAIPETGGTPDWVHLVPSGTFRGKDGRGPYHLVDAEAVIRASMHGGKLPIDENHAIDLAAPTGGASPARGWIVEMQARPDGIWGRVDWTPTGTALMAERAYRGISPALEYDARTGQVAAVRRAALVNDPNLVALATLHHSQGTGMDLAQQIRAALGLPETADDAAIVAAARTANAAVATHAAQLAAIASAAGVAAGNSDAIVTALQATQRDAAGAATMRAEVARLQTDLQAMRGDRARERAEAYIDGQIKAGKPIVTALRQHYIDRHMADPASVEKEVGAMLSLNMGGLGDRAVIEGALHAAADGLTPQERAVAARMNLDPAQFASQRDGKLKAPDKKTGGK